MSRGCTIFKPTDLPESNSSGYPAPFREGQRKRWNRRLGDHGGLKNFGVNFVRVEPGGQSSARHSHTKQDEFVYIMEGEFVLVTDAGRETVGPGTCIGTVNLCGWGRGDTCGSGWAPLGDSDIVEHATIPVEKTRGPILLISGQADQMSSPKLERFS